jgi:hypothetical protein
MKVRASVNLPRIVMGVILVIVSYFTENTTGLSPDVFHLGNLVIWCFGSLLIASSSDVIIQ